MCIRGAPPYFLSCAPLQMARQERKKKIERLEKHRPDPNLENPEVSSIEIIIFIM